MKIFSSLLRPFVKYLLNFKIDYKTFQKEARRQYLGRPTLLAILMKCTAILSHDSCQRSHSLLWPCSRRWASFTERSKKLVLPNLGHTEQGFHHFAPSKLGSKKARIYGNLCNKYQLSNAYLDGHKIWDVLRMEKKYFLYQVKFS